MRLHNTDNSLEVVSSRLTEVKHSLAQNFIQNLLTAYGLVQVQRKFQS